MSVLYDFASFFGEELHPRIAAHTAHHATRVPPHDHDYYEMVYAVSGFALHSCAHRTTLLTPGDLFIIPPGVEHSYLNPYKNSVLNFVFYLEDFGDMLNREDSLPELLTLIGTNRSFEPTILHVDIAERRSFENAFEKISQERTQKPLGWRTSICARMMLLLTKYARLHAVQCGDDADALAGGYHYILQILRYIEKNYAADITTAELSALTGLHPDYMARKFKSIISISPAEYIRKFRVAKAMEWLCSTDATVTEVATMCGFGDISVFSRIFKNSTGISPTDFRKSRASDLN